MFLERDLRFLSTFIPVTPGILNKDSNVPQTSELVANFSAKSSNLSALRYDKLPSLQNVQRERACGYTMWEEEGGGGGGAPLDGPPCD